MTDAFRGQLRLLDVPSISVNPKEMTGSGKHLQSRLKEGAATASWLYDTGRRETSTPYYQADISGKSARSLEVAEFRLGSFLDCHRYFALNTPATVAELSIIHVYIELREVGAVGNEPSRNSNRACR
ncbi:MAG TPA: hypothetical protein VFS12_15865 [Terriglobia bacterium]|nr:hypothetical protein [Terriglobia bacterium]